MPMYTVYLIDHFSSPGDDASKAGFFDTYEQAEEKCRQIIGDFFKSPLKDERHWHQYEEGLTAENLLRNWRAWGESPFISPAKKKNFEAAKYAEKCAQKAYEREVEKFAEKLGIDYSIEADLLFKHWQRSHLPFAKWKSAKPTTPTA